MSFTTYDVCREGYDFEEYEVGDDGGFSSSNCKTWTIKNKKGDCIQKMTYFYDSAAVNIAGFGLLTATGEVGAVGKDGTDYALY